MERKTNCWEFMKCGRGPKGPKVKELGICPAAVHTASEALNGGINGGRMCWAIAGIYSCEDRKKSPFRLLPPCYDCDFHWKVLTEEGIIRPGTSKRNMVPSR